MDTAAVKQGDATLYIALISFALTVPISLGAVAKIEINPAFLLAPAIAYAIWKTRDDLITRVFILSGLCGLVSIAAIHLMVPGNLKGNIAELAIWMMFSPSFLFLGRRMPLKETVFWLAIMSATFLIVITVPLLITGEPVRTIYFVETNGHGMGTSYLNVQFFGIPIFGTFGVNSLAPFFCIQSALICGALYSASRPVSVFLSAGLASAVLLIIETDSRTAQGTLALLAVLCAGFMIKKPRQVGPALTVVCAVLVSGAGIGIRGLEGGRLVASLSDTFEAASADNLAPATPDGSIADDARPRLSEQTMDPKATTPTAPTMESITTGRTILWRDALRDTLHSPVFGNGFAGFGRFFPTKNAEGNTTAHLYYLTIFWKGGVMFAIPFLGFVGLSLWRAWGHRRMTPEWYFSATAVISMFLLPSLSWDILLIPSAGALSWFILGVIQGNE